MNDTIWRFAKMHGLGNDFVVLDGVRQHLHMTPERARALAHRHCGVGADQILLVEPAQHPEADFRYRIFNADGGEVEHCGNGARCFARFVHETGLSTRNPLSAEIATGLLRLDEAADGQVTVAMGVPCFDPAALAFDTRDLMSMSQHRDTLWQLPRPPSGNEANEDAAASVALSLVAIANPHAVQVVEDVDRAAVTEQGSWLATHPRFARGVNAGFLQIIDRATVRLRVYERGAGETLACGTGACAAVVAGIRRGLLTTRVRVQTHGGWLTIAWEGDQIQMTGPAVTVYHGEINIDALLRATPVISATPPPAQSPTH